MYWQQCCSVLPACCLLHCRATECAGVHGAVLHCVASMLPALHASGACFTSSINLQGPFAAVYNIWNNTGVKFTKGKTSSQVPTWILVIGELCLEPS